MRHVDSAASNDPSRRAVLAAGASLTGLGVSAFLGGLACAGPRSSRTSASARATGDDDRHSDDLLADDLLDHAYERIAERFPDANIHRSNHAPMVAEVLAVLGHADAIAPWLDHNLDDFQRDTGERVPIEGEQWRAALAHVERYADWQALFLDELARDEWELVLRRWVPRLAPGLAGAATHGLIRTGHAARALAARDNAIRRHELATALAYWAINYEELPWDGTLAPAPSIAAALAQVEPRQPAQEPPPGNIVSGLRVLSATPSFRPLAGLVDTRDPARTLSEITAAFAELYLRNPERRIAFTHTVTAPSALRLLLPHLDEETARAGVRYAWQAAAGIHVVYGDPRHAEAAARPLAERASTIARAVANGKAHGLKLLEACLREDALAPAPLAVGDSVLLRAAQDSAEEQTG